MILRLPAFLDEPAVMRRKRIEMPESFTYTWRKRKFGKILLKKGLSDSRQSEL